ncbi:uncharacterized protein LOC121377456 isoform X3 [Gigantopelta aegis]|uniref:uncharacterized protein LOC121377456 isoform X3 n=1 Tax=Gigantopelta aegis TaxID=1735272 RepID=UPI001B88B3B8|nr:uncharacterized protein LOC121377456 isoform X3 [Gigantopelta aegis]XP_041361382.1 uncharacterized protein LOC121377456 isoform X3 [Gigantopelta aegis]
MFFRRHQGKLILIGCLAILYLVYATYFSKSQSSIIDGLMTHRRISENLIPEKMKNIPNEMVVTEKQKNNGELRKTVISQSDPAVLVFKNNEWKQTSKFCTGDYELEQRQFQLLIGDVFIYTNYGAIDVSQATDAVFRVFIDHLTSDPELGFVDFGILKAEYALTAARYGREVTVLTESQINAHQLCKSVLKNNFLDKRLVFYTGNDVNEQGELARVIETPTNSKDNYSTLALRSPDLIPYIRSKRVIVKIDVEGQEFQVLHRADVLFQQVEAKVVMMSWDNVKMTPFAASLIEIFLGNYMKPYSVYSDQDVNIPAKTELNLNAHKAWPTHVQWIKNNRLD